MCVKIAIVLLVSLIYLKSDSNDVILSKFDGRWSAQITWSHKISSLLAKIENQNTKILGLSSEITFTITCTVQIHPMAASKPVEQGSRASKSFGLNDSVWGSRKKVHGGDIY